MEPASIAFAVVVVFCGAFVRGYAGFGSSMIWVSSLSLVFPPILVIPAVFLLEIAVGANLLPKVWREVEWRSLRWLLAGAVVATPAAASICSPRYPQHPCASPSQSSSWPRRSRYGAASRGGPCRAPGRRRPLECSPAR